jgi:predicted ABC-type ATPase
MLTKRLRVFAGPNGSGKTTIVKKLQGEIPFGVYVNADDIERRLRESSILLFDDYQLVVKEAEIQQFFKQSTFSPIKRNDTAFWRLLTVKKNVLQASFDIDSYLAAELADFIRQKLVANGISFTYETVMSHESKVNFLRKAKEAGYRIYLYYIATEDPEINIRRIDIRVLQSGHYVPPKTVESRYYRSLNLLKSAIKLTNRAYLWDNSGLAALLIAEITEGEDVQVVDNKNVPVWFIKHVWQAV